MWSKTPNCIGRTPLPRCPDQVRGCLEVQESLRGAGAALKPRGAGCVRSVPLVGRHLLEADAIADLDAATLDRDRAVTAKMHEHAAHRLDGQAKMIGHV